MDPEFQRIIIRVALIGGAIIAIGAGALVIAFRSFEKRDFRATVLVGAVLVFVMVCCVALFMMSMFR